MPRSSNALVYRQRIKANKKEEWFGAATRRTMHSIQTSVGRRALPRLPTKTRALKLYNEKMESYGTLEGISDSDGIERGALHNIDDGKIFNSVKFCQVGDNYSNIQKCVEIKMMFKRARKHDRLTPYAQGRVKLKSLYVTMSKCRRYGVGMAADPVPMFDDRKLVCLEGTAVSVRVLTTATTSKEFRIHANESTTLHYVEYDLNILEGCPPCFCVFLDAVCKTVLDKKTKVIEKFIGAEKTSPVVYILLVCQIKPGPEPLPDFNPGDTVDLKTMEFCDGPQYQSRQIYFDKDVIHLGATVRTQR